MDVDKTLDDTYELDIFLSNTTHFEFLNRVTRDERRQSSKQYKYTKEQIMETLETFTILLVLPIIWWNHCR